MEFMGQIYGYAYKTVCSIPGGVAIQIGRRGGISGAS